MLDSVVCGSQAITSVLFVDIKMLKSRLTQRPNCVVYGVLLSDALEQSLSIKV